MSTNCYERGGKNGRKIIDRGEIELVRDRNDRFVEFFSHSFSFVSIFISLSRRKDKRRENEGQFFPPFSFISIILILFVETEHNNTWMESKYLARIGFGKEIFRRSLNYRYALGLPGIVIKTDRGKKEKERGRERNNEERRVTRGERELYVNSHYRGSH